MSRPREVRLDLSRWGGVGPHRPGGAPAVQRGGDGRRVRGRPHPCPHARGDGDRPGQGAPAGETAQADAPSGGSLVQLHAAATRRRGSSLSCSALPARRCSGRSSAPCRRRRWSDRAPHLECVSPGEGFTAAGPGRLLAALRRHDDVPRCRWAPAAATISDLVGPRRVRAEDRRRHGASGQPLGSLSPAVRVERPGRCRRGR